MRQQLRKRNSSRCSLSHWVTCGRRAPHSATLGREVKLNVVQWHVACSPPRTEGSASAGARFWRPVPCTCAIGEGSGARIQSCTTVCVVSRRDSDRCLRARRSWRIICAGRCACTRRIAFETPTGKLEARGHLSIQRSNHRRPAADSPGRSDGSTCHRDRHRDVSIAAQGTQEKWCRRDLRRGIADADLFPRHTKHAEYGAGGILP